jgi:hypothetical protein
VTLRIQDSNATSLSVSLLSTNGNISVVTWAVLSGLCDPACSSCSYSALPTACLGCNYFL